VSAESAGANRETRAASAGAAVAADGDSALPADGTAAAGAKVTVVPGIARYHKSDCILIRFLGAEDLETMSIGQAEETGCVPCRACRPEKELATA
jgi:hypothetical protein